jgi:hypothetical protein
MLHALRYVASAVRHAETLADEAEDLGVLDLAHRLRRQATELTADLDGALHGLEDIDSLRATRERAYETLVATYLEGTLDLERLCDAGEASLWSPGGHVDVAERARYRMRRLPSDRPELNDVRALLERSLFAYESAVDAFLASWATTQSRRDRAVARSQVLRVELERAKHALLRKAEPGTEAWRRIRRRIVRTKRARWLDDARVNRLLSEMERDPFQVERDGTMPIAS